MSDFIAEILSGISFTYVISNLQEKVKCLARLLYSSPRQCASAQCSNMEGVFDKFLMFHILLSWPLTTFSSSSNSRSVKRCVSELLEDVDQNDHNTHRGF
jgi:hypothetical protein